MKNRVKNILFGILLLVLITCIIMWKLNVLAIPVAFGMVSTWQLVIAAIMIVVIVMSIVDINYVGIFFPAAVICCIFAEPLHIQAITPWIVLLAALVLTIAFELLFPSRWIKRHFKKVTKKHCDDFGGTINVDFTEKDDCSYTSDNDENIFYSIKMGGGSKYVTTSKLKTADLSSEFGELNAYFDKAQAPDGEVKIHCKVAFGEINLFLPSSWNVVNNVTVSMGDITDRASNIPGEEGGVKCIITGSVNFGDLVINKI